MEKNPSPCSEAQKRLRVRERGVKSSKTAKNLEASEKRGGMLKKLGRGEGKKEDI